MDIYVGNLPYDTEESLLREAFEEFGKVEKVKIVVDHDTGRSKGFAFVSMENNDEGQKAISELNEAEINGRTIKVNEARPREDRPRGNNRNFSGGGGGAPRQDRNRSFKGGNRGKGGGDNRGRGRNFSRGGRGHRDQQDGFSDNQGW